MSRLQIRRLSQVGIIVPAIAGAWIAGELLMRHDGGWDSTQRAGSGFLLRFCDEAAPADSPCTKTAAGRWGSFDVHWRGRRFLFPTSFLGLAYFSALAIWTVLVIRPSAPSRWACGATGVYVACGLASSLFLLGIMAFVENAWCGPCVAVHVINGVVFASVICLWRAMRSDGTTSTPPAVTATRGAAWLEARLALAGLTAAGIAVVGLWYHFDTTQEAHRQWRKARDYARAISALQDDRGLVLNAYYAQPVEEISGSRLCDDGCSPGASATLTLLTDSGSDSDSCFQGYLDRVIVPSLGDGVCVRRRPRAAWAPTPESLAGDMASSRVDETGSDSWVPVLFLNGRRVPDVCVKSETFWLAVGSELAVPSLVES